MSTIDESDLLQWQDRAYDAESRNEHLQIALEDARSDVRAWENRADDLEAELTDTRIDRQDALDTAEDLDNALDQAREEKDRLEYERDCYKEVLKGMEFIEIDTYPEKGEEFCRRLGVEAKETIETVINQALEKR